MSQKPLLRRGGLTGQVFLITHYKVKRGRIEAIQKVDITEEYQVLLRTEPPLLPKEDQTDG